MGAKKHDVYYYFTFLHILVSLMVSIYDKQNRRSHNGDS